MAIGYKGRDDNDETALAVLLEAEKMLILNNDDVRAVLTMEMAIDALK